MQFQEHCYQYLSYLDLLIYIQKQYILWYHLISQLFSYVFKLIREANKNAFQLKIIGGELC
ncbi:unnamed protein product [Paramecium sonneborni]|uniref:Uncharacterized protein n=1 Tax=Paramecium sonneborni TaxID=65129 RepID=A0A8S1LWI9_9CILI|nr:unnamed protein product [Paramecium sonneborni]